MPIPLLLISLILYSGSAIAEDDANNLSEDDLIIIEARFGNITLSDALFAFQTDNATFIPLQELSGLLDFPITVRTEQGQADGWFIDPDNTFILDLEKQTLEARGQKLSLPDNHLITVQDGDLYIPIKLLEQWFPIQLKLNFADLRLTITSTEPLPMEQRLSRQKKRKGLGSRQPDKTPVIRYQADRYRWASYPTLDASLNGSYNSQHDNPALALSLNASGDLLKHAAFLNYSTNTDSNAQNIRFNLTRYASTPEQRLPGGLFSYQLGDLYTPGDGLISSGGDGIGIALQSSALRRTSDYSTTVVEGDAPAGWEAELYRNNSLLAFQTVSEDGIYRFEEVELNYGNNNFEVRLFGPQGQSRIDRSSNYIGSTQLRPGHFDYAVYLLDEENNRLFGDQTSMNSRRSQLDLRAEVNYGVTRNWSSGLVWNRLAREENGLTVDHDYLSFDNTLSLNGLFLQSSLAQDSDGGNAGLLSLRTRLAEQNIDIEHRHFNRFSSEKNPLDNPLAHDTEFRLSGNLKLDRYINYSLSAEQQTYLDAPTRYNLKTRLSTQLAGINFTHSQSASKTAGSDNLSLPGSISASYYRAGSGLSSTLAYNLEADEDPISSITANVRNTLDSRRHNLLKLSYTPGENDRWSVSNSFSWKLDQANLTLKAETNSDHNWRLAAGVNFSTGYDAWRNSPWISARASSRTGTLNTHIFWDRDNSGTFSEGDEPISGASLLGAGVDREARSDEAGRLQLRNLPTLRAVNLDLNTDSLEDPYWELRSAPDALYLHSGAQAELELPVVAVSEIEGQLFSADNAGQYPLRATRLLLINDLGNVVATTTTEYDGFFLFDSVNPGHYQVVTDDGQLRQKGLPTPPPQSVQATAEGGILNTGTTVLYSRGSNSDRPARGSAQRQTDGAPARDWASVKPRYIRPAALKRQPSSHYAVQLLATASVTDMQTFTRQHNITHSHFVRIPSASTSQFRLLLGIYPSAQQAHQVLDSLPSALHQQHPVVLPVREIQALLAETPGLQDPYPPRYPQHYQLQAETLPERLTVTRDWLRSRAGHGYTLQLLASYDPADLTRFIATHQLQQQGLIVETEREGRPWYLLLYGYHPERRGALQLRAGLPAAMTEAGPWIRSLETLAPIQLAAEAP